MVGGTDSRGQELLLQLECKKNTPFISLGALSGLSLDVLQEPILFLLCTFLSHIPPSCSVRLAPADGGVL